MNDSRRDSSPLAAASTPDASAHVGAQDVGSAGRFSLPELTKAAGVSVRTVRYYIAEGLLPPPTAAGAKSFYTRQHLGRLRLIAHLKAAYLPLKEIRRRLDGLDDTAIEALLDAEETLPPAPRPPDSAAAYVDRLLKAGEAPPEGMLAPGRATSLSPPTDSPPGAGRAGPHYALMTPFESSEAQSYEAAPPSGPTLGMAAMAGVAPAADEPGSWRRVPLGDDAELLIKEEAYQRKRDRIEWLITWTRKVFG